MSVVVYDYTYNGATPGAINPESYDTNPTGSVINYFVLLEAKPNIPRSIERNFQGIEKLSLHIEWTKATATGVFRVQLGMHGSTDFITAFEFDAATDFNNAVDNAIGLTFNSGTYEIIRFDGSGVTGGSPIVRMG